jgi:hypothetical protein
MDGQKALLQRRPSEYYPPLSISLDIWHRHRSSVRETLDKRSFASGELQDLHQFRPFTGRGHDLQLPAAIGEQESASLGIEDLGALRHQGV